MSSETEQTPIQLVIPPDQAGRRLDQVLAELLPDYSRTRIKAWIEAGQVRVNGLVMRPKDPVLGDENVQITPVFAVDDRVQGEAIALDIVHQDAHLYILNKPAGLVVHPGAGNPKGTLQNALLHHEPGLAILPRSGIVHRIDKDTSGLLVIARTLEAHTALTDMIEEHSVERQYEAVCVGVMTAGGTVDKPIGRHPTDRIKMAIRSDGREAVTHYRVVSRFRAHTHVRLQLETGRTHQIRVHMAHAGYPLVGDAVYGTRRVLPKEATPALVDALQGFQRQALHAARLSFAHPITGKDVVAEAPIPADMKQLLKVLQADVRHAEQRRREDPRAR